MRIPAISTMIMVSKLKKEVTKVSCQPIKPPYKVDCNKNKERKIWE